MVELDDETIKKILLFKDLKSNKIKDEKYLNCIIKDLEECIKLYEQKNKKYAEFIKNNKYEKLKKLKYFNFKKYYKKLSNLKN